MALSSAYTSSYNKLEEFFGKLREAQVPGQFTYQILKDLGYKSNNHRAYVKIMKDLGFLSSDGKPTPRYSDYRDNSKSKKVMGEALKESYGDIFLIKEKPTLADKSTIQGKFKSFNNTSDAVAKLMTGTFYALLNMAELEPSDSQNVETPTEETQHLSELKQVNKHTGLHYNIQIHLPPTKDVEVFNAIFKAIKEYLY